jgi:hypothetical protein
VKRVAVGVKFVDAVARGLPFITIAPRNFPR